MREQLEPMAHITAKCYLKLAEWHSSMAMSPVSGKHQNFGAFLAGKELMSPSTAALQQQYLWSDTFFYFFP